MAVTTFPVPLTTLKVGSRTFGPFDVPTGNTQVKLLIDRTVAVGLNAKAAAVDIEVDESDDGGVTWQPLVSGHLTGGGVAPQSGVWVRLNGAPSLARKVRGVLTVNGSQVAVQGTLTVS